MRKFIHYGLMLALIFLLSGCAQSYYALNPRRLTYTASNNLEDIKLDYRYNILSETGNKKMSKKERKHNVKLVAVKITNNTDNVITIGKNAAFFSGNSMIYPMDALTTKNSLKQSVPSHLFYLLLTPLTFSVNGSKPFPIGLILGPVISGGNMLAAGGANNKLYKELTEYDLLFRNIEPGETVCGLVGFKNLDYAPLTVRLIQ